MEKQKHEMIEIFSGTPWEAEMVKNQLGNEGIEAFVIDSMMGTLFPWQTAPGGVGSVRVTISTLDYEKAKVVVEEYEGNKL